MSGSNLNTGTTYRGRSNLTCSNFMGHKIPMRSGSCLRLFPFFISRYLLNKEAKKKEVIVYMHPYELDTQKYPDYFMQELNLVPLKKKIFDYI